LVVLRLPLLFYFFFKFYFLHRHRFYFESLSLSVDLFPPPPFFTSSVLLDLLLTRYPARVLQLIRYDYFVTSYLPLGTTPAAPPHFIPNQ